MLWLKTESSHLERGEEEVDEKLGETQTDCGLGGLICHKNKDHLMDTQQRDQGQSGLSQPEMDGMRDEPERERESTEYSKFREREYTAHTSDM